MSIYITGRHIGRLQEGSSLPGFHIILIKLLKVQGTHLPIDA